MVEIAESVAGIAGEVAQSGGLDLKPLNDQVVIEMVAFGEKSAGGIIYSEAQQKTITWKGKVLAVGPGKQLANGNRAEMEVAVGDLVHYTAYAGIEISRQGLKLRILSEADILGVYGEKNP